VRAYRAQQARGGILGIGRKFYNGSNSGQEKVGFVRIS
jgi:hypothetical protein